MAKIFISYSSRDAEIAGQIYTALIAVGHQVWMDREALKGGQDWLQAIQDNLLWADTLVVLWSANALNSEWVQDEIAFARAKRKHIIPLRLDNTDPSAHIIINALQLIDMRDGLVEPAVERINTALTWPIRVPSVERPTVPSMRWPLAAALVATLALALLIAPSLIRTISQPDVTEESLTPPPAVTRAPTTSVTPTRSVSEVASIETLNAWRQANGYAPLNLNQTLHDVADLHLRYLRSLSRSELDQTNTYRDADGRDAQWLATNAGYDGQVQMYVEVTEADRVPLDKLLFELDNLNPGAQSQYRDVGLVAEQAVNTGLYYFVMILGAGV